MIMDYLCSLVTNLHSTNYFTEGDYGSATTKAAISDLGPLRN